MHRDKLVKLLMNASELEESHSSTVAKFFVDDFDWDGVEEEKVNRVKEILKTIGNQTMEHNRIINDLVGTIRDAIVDEF
jgi:hypothetical protein